MTDREHIHALISAYIDGETTADETRQVKELLVKDPEARKYYDELQTLSSSLQSWTDEDLSPDLNQKVLAVFDRQKNKEGDMNKTWKVPTVAVGLMVMICVGILSMQVYVKRGIQGRWKSAADDIGNQYSPPRQGQSVSQVKPFMMLPHEGRGQAVQTTQPAALRPDANYASVIEGKEASASVARQEYAEVKDGNGVAGLSSRTRSANGQQLALGKTMQYEPYYLSTDYDVYRDQGKTRYDLSEKTRGAGMAVDEEMSMPIIRVPGQQPTDWNTEQYDRIYENEFKDVLQNPLSTLSIDVDTASYSNLRRFLNQNQMPPADAVRIEEMINYFSYDYPEPNDGHPFSITTETAPCPWQADHQLVLVGLQGKRLKSDELPASNLVFLIDVSGSMSSTDKLPLLKQSYRMMVQQLRQQDTVSIVVYAGAAGEVLAPTPGDQKQTILNAIDKLNSGGSTAGGAGIKLAYELAKKNYVKDGNNRVILATDGDFNVGVSSNGELVRMIEEKRKDGIFLTILGFGTGNYKDNRMEQLADKGNGNYFYIDTIKEAKKVLVQELGSALFAIAKDVKIQVEFNPGQVKSYRLIGYENRILAKEDFNDDTKDAGELGTGHTVTALYEVVPAGSQEQHGNVDPLKYQQAQVKTSDELLTVKFRYKRPDEDTSRLLTRTLQPGQSAAVSNNLQWSASVAEFGMLLRDSRFKGSSTYQDALIRSRAAKWPDQWGFRQEMIELIEKAQMLDTRTQSSGGISTK